MGRMLLMLLSLNLSLTENGSVCARAARKIFPWPNFNWESLEEKNSCSGLRKQARAITSLSETMMCPQDRSLASCLWIFYEQKKLCAVFCVHNTTHKKVESTLLSIHLHCSASLLVLMILWLTWMDYRAHTSEGNESAKLYIAIVEL